MDSNEATSILDQLDELLDSPPDSFEFEVDHPDEETSDLLYPKTEHKYTAAQFESPLDLLVFNEPFRLELITPHEWQVACCDLVSKYKYTKDDPLRLLLCTCNGSGKDSVIISNTAVWFIWTNIRSKCIITSASWNQLQSQTEAYIRTLCQSINDELGRKVFVIKKMCILCVDTGSIIWMFTTDDPGRAEGHHPFIDYKDSKVMIIINEAKTVKDEIFGALGRCTFAYWIEVSTPGNTKGHFYQSVIHGIQYPEEYKRQSLDYYCFKVTSSMCPHISQNKIEFDKKELGEHSPLFRSRHLAEFTSLDESVIITLEAVLKCFTLAKEEYQLGTLTGGCDLAAGGDENTFYPFRNNISIGREVFRATDTVVTQNFLMQVAFPKYGFTKENCKNVNADDGGIGRGIIDNLHDAGWKVTRVNNQHRALRTDLYGNRGAEMWYNFKRLIEECIPVLPQDDTKLRDQLSSRYYRHHVTTGKLICEPKKEAKAKGHGSPDRADGVVLAFSRINVNDFINTQRKRPLRNPQDLSNNKNAQRLLMASAAAKLMDDRKFSQFADWASKVKSRVADNPRIRTITKTLHSIYGN